MLKNNIISKIKDLIDSGEKISIPYIQRKFKISFDESREIFYKFYPPRSIQNDVIEIIERVKSKDFDKYRPIIEETVGKKFPIQCFFSRKRVKCSTSIFNSNKEDYLQSILFHAKCPKGYEVNYIIPLSKGGKDILENLQYIPKEDYIEKLDITLDLKMNGKFQILALYYEITSWIEDNIPSSVEKIMSLYEIGKRYAKKIHNFVMEEIKLKNSPNQNGRNYYFEMYWKDKKKLQNVSYND